MPPYLSPEWVRAFNHALSGLDLSDAVAAAGAGSLTVSQGTFRVAQVVTGGPEGLAAPGAAGAAGAAASNGSTVRTVLTVDGGKLTLVEDPTGAIAANVTVVLTYDDALAIARGSLQPADALAAGRVRVRGELSVLVAGQAVLNAAAVALGRTLTDLTDLDAPNDRNDRNDQSDPSDQNAPTQSSDPNGPAAADE
jgi:putative sterol carrier protein